MLPFFEILFVWIGVTVVPAFLGILLITALGRWTNPRYLVAFALGIFFWFFVDTIEGSADLDVSSGFGGGLPQASLVLLFAVGILAFLYADRNAFTSGSTASSLTLAVPLLAALAIGIHGFGEGTAVGSTAALTSSNSVLGPNGAFGDFNAGLGYFLHKAYEPMIPGALYAVFAKGRAEGWSTWLRNALALTTLFVLPSLVGVTTGYFISYDATYFYALGTGTAVYALVRMTKFLNHPMDEPTGSASLKISLAIIAGFILIYLAALLHS